MGALNGFLEGLVGTGIAQYNRTSDAAQAQANADREFGLRKEYHDAHMAGLNEQNAGLARRQAAYDELANAFAPQQAAPKPDLYGLTGGMGGGLLGPGATAAPMLDQGDVGDGGMRVRQSDVQAPVAPQAVAQATPDPRKILGLRMKVARAENNASQMASIATEHRLLDVNDAFDADRKRMQVEPEYRASVEKRLIGHVQDNVKGVTYHAPVYDDQGNVSMPAMVSIAKPNGNNALHPLKQNDLEALLKADHLVNNGFHEEGYAAIKNVNKDLADAVIRSNKQAHDLAGTTNSGLAMTEGLRARRDATEANIQARRDAADERDAARKDSQEFRRQQVEAQNAQRRTKFIMDRADDLVGTPTGQTGRDGKPTVHTRASAIQAATTEHASIADSGGPEAGAAPGGRSALIDGLANHFKIAPPGQSAPQRGGLSAPGQTPARTARGGAWLDEESSAPPTNPNQQFSRALELERATPQEAALARAIWGQESGAGGNTSTSNRGAHGHMQITGGTFASVADPDWRINNPEHNMRGGIRYIRQALNKSGGDPRLAAAYYYGGPGGMRKARQGVPVYDPVNPRNPSTLQYADQVVGRMASANGTGIAPTRSN